MAYTNAWTVTVPNGTEALSTADNEIRKLRLDIQERMASLGLDWTVDPVTGTITKYHYVPWSFFFLQDGSGTEATPGAAAHYGFSVTAGTDILYAPVILPRGSIITGMTISGAATGTGTLTCQLIYVDTTSTPAETTITTITATGVAQAQYAASPFTHTVDDTPANYKYYSLKVTTAAGGAGVATFQGIRIAYTTEPFGGV